MTEKDDGGPAFPTEDDNRYQHGMTLRDWFAGQALADLLDSNDYDPENVARAAYIIADAMLAQRKED